MNNFTFKEITKEILKVGDILRDKECGHDWEVMLFRKCEMMDLEVCLWNEFTGFKFLEALDITKEFLLKVEEKPIPFGLDLFQTGEYDVQDREGNSIELIVSKNRLAAGEAFPLLGVRENGCSEFYTTSGTLNLEYPLDDLFLIKKELK